MATQLGKTLAYYFNGLNFSGSHNDYQTDLAIEPLDNTCFGPSFHKTSQPGPLDAKISVKGYFSYTVAPDGTGLENVLRAALRVNTPALAVLPGAGTIPAAGDLADLWVTSAYSKKIATPVDALITLEADLSTSTGLHFGVVMQAETAFTGAPFNSTGYDQGGGAWVSATYPYLVALHVTAYTSGLAAVLVQTSTDNSTWNTRGTFPAITGVGGYVLPINATLDRYIRIRDTGVATILPAFALTY